MLITDLLVTHVAALIEHERTNMINAWENICRERQKLSSIYRWAIENFPHTSSQWFTEFPGHVVQPHGDAYVLSQCFNVTNYVIYWNRTYNNTCYSISQYILFLNNISNIYQLLRGDYRVIAL